MFRLRNKQTDYWYKSMDEDGDIIWTDSKVEALVFPPDKKEFWQQEYGDEVEIVPLAEDEVMARMEAPRLPGF